MAELKVTLLIGPVARISILKKAHRKQPGTPEKNTFRNPPMWSMNRERLITTFVQKTAESLKGRKKRSLKSTFDERRQKVFKNGTQQRGSVESRTWLKPEVIKDYGKLKSSMWPRRQKHEWSIWSKNDW
jgi:hypothetical protein